MPDKISAISLGNGQLKKAVLYAQVPSGESRILDEHWSKITARCKGEKELLKALKITDKRVKP